MNRGSARGDQGGTAAADFDQAIKLDSRNAIAWSNRCGAHYNQGAFDRAIADRNQASAQAGWADFYSSRGIAWLMLGRLEKAEADFARRRELGGTLKPEAEWLWNEAKKRRTPR